MAFDEGLAQRIREYFQGHTLAEEKRMFGGLGFLLSGNMCVGVMGDEMVVRVGPPNYTAALARPHARPFDFTGRAMQGWVMVGADGLAEDEDLHSWLVRGEQFASALPPK